MRDVHLLDMIGERRLIPENIPAFMRRAKLSQRTHATISRPWPSIYCCKDGRAFIHAVCAKPSHRLVSVCQLVSDRSKIDEDYRAENRDSGHRRQGQADASKKLTDPMKMNRSRRAIAPSSVVGDFFESNVC